MKSTWTYLYIHLFDKYLLSTCYMLENSADAEKQW